VNIWPIAWRLAKGNRLAVDIGGSEQKGMVTFAHPPAGPFASAGVAVPNDVAPAGKVSVHTGAATVSFIRLAVNSSS
jgi:predicted acyl esterase